MAQIDITKMTAKDFKKEFKDMVLSLESVRAGGQNKKPVDVSFEELVQGKWGISQATLFEKIGLNPKVDTMQNIFDMPEQDVRWIVPEIIRAAITVGMRTAPFYPTIIQGDQPINGLTAIQPWVNMSDAAPAKINEAETIPLGTVSFGQKSVTLFKIGKGFKLTDEVRNYVSLDILGIYLRDFGIQLGYALDTLALDTLLLGNKGDGSEAASVMGITTANSLVYKDLLRVWVRGARLGRNFTTMIGSESTGLSLLDLAEFKTRSQGTTEATLNLHTPVPNTADMWIHPGVADTNIVMVDPKAALIKLTAKQLMLESERIVSNQTEAVYATLTTGFSKIYNDSVIVLDTTKAFSSYGFPEYMNHDPYQLINLE
jgi:hypothetical protein